MEQRKPFGQAARELGLSEEALRRKILLGEVEATPVDDDRQYLVAFSEPARPPCCGRFRLYLWCLAAWAMLGVSVTLGSGRTVEACRGCGAARTTERLMGVPTSQETVHVGGMPCRHEWRPR